MQYAKQFLYLSITLLIGLITMTALKGQERHSVLVGTQFPVQWTAGYQFNIDDHYAVRGQLGLLTPPYDKFIIKSMKAFGFDERLGNALDESFERGIVGTLAPQYRFGNNYLMLQGQYVHLTGSITLERALELYLKDAVTLPDLSNFPFLPLLMPELTTRSNLFLLGVAYGRKFPLPNTPMAIGAEVGFTKSIGSVNRFSSNLGALDEISLVQDYYRQMDSRLKDSYRRYGYIPSLSLYLVYHFGSRNQ